MNFFRNLFGGGTSSADLKARVAEGAFLVDVRTPAEYAEGHVPGSVNIPLDRVPFQLHQFRNKKHIIVFCRSGNRSGMAKSLLQANGIAPVTNGGSWQQVKRRLS